MSQSDIPQPPTSAPDDPAVEEIEISTDQEAPAEEAPVEEAPAEEAPAEEGELIEGVAFIEPDPALAQAQAQAREVEARLRAVSSAYKQLQSDMSNARERMKRQAQFERDVQRGELVAGLFEPLENLRRSINAMEKDETVSAEAKEGLAHVGKQFLDAFLALGLEETGEKGAPFDPNLHEAIGVIPVTDPEQDEAIVEVFSTGYRIGSRLLQPARVIIGRVAEEPSEA
jgi:molecular chaperone GrpE